jgi:hypothetical protein
VRRSTCTSALALLLAGAAAARAASADLLRARSLELEAGLAKTKAIYLYLDPGQRVIEVRSRGMTLDRAALQSVMMLHHHPLFGRDDQPEPEVPGLWTVDQGPGDLSREVIAPEALKPYVPEDQRQDESSTPQAAKPVPPPPSQYLVPLTNGWSLVVLDREPRAGFLHRYSQAVKDGWARLRGTPIVRPPLVALTMSSADAQRFHHVFRSQLPVLVAAGGG